MRHPAVRQRRRFSGKKDIQAGLTPPDLRRGWEWDGCICAIFRKRRNCGRRFWRRRQPYFPVHVFRRWESLSLIHISGLLRAAHFIPETRSLDDLFGEMQSKKIHMSIVVDEYLSLIHIYNIKSAAFQQTCARAIRNIVLMPRRTLRSRHVEHADEHQPGQPVVGDHGHQVVHRGD